MLHLMEYNNSKWQIWLESNGYPKYRSRQIVQWVHQKKVLDASLMHNLPKDLRDKIANNFDVFIPKTLSERISTDGVVKWLFASGSGNAIETVFIPEETRGTLCISSQVGCALACTFCLTGDQGFNRNLSTAEILLQVQLAQSRLNILFSSGEFFNKITNVVFMGMGEPLMNELAVFPALDLLLSDDAYGLSKYKVTVSTSGVVPSMKRLKESSECSLAVSLHAANNELRSQIMPINNKYNLDDLKSACLNYFSLDSKRSIVFEYIMLRDVNDSLNHAKDLVEWLKDFKYCKVNLIPFNEYAYSKYFSSLRDDVLKFQTYLKNNGIITTIRKTRGEKILAACGQLAGQVLDRKSSSVKVE